MTAVRDGLGAIVLAGGRSSRFGRDKLAVPFGDRPLLHHAIEAARALGPGVEVVVVAAPGVSMDLPPGVRLVHDATAHEGPLAGVAVGLTALTASVDRAVIVAGDMPGIVPAVLALLDDALVDGAEAVVLEDPGDPRPHVFPIAVRRTSAQAAADRLLRAGTRRFGALAAALGARVVPAAAWRAVDPRGTTPRDIDVPGDLDPT